MLQRYCLAVVAVILCTVPLAVRGDLEAGPAITLATWQGDWDGIADQFDPVMVSIDEFGKSGVLVLSSTSLGRSWLFHLSSARMEPDGLIKAMFQSDVDADEKVELRLKGVFSRKSSKVGSLRGSILLFSSEASGAEESIALVSASEKAFSKMTLAFDVAQKRMKDAKPTWEPRPLK